MVFELVMVWFQSYNMCKCMYKYVYEYVCLHVYVYMHSNICEYLSEEKKKEKEVKGLWLIFKTFLCIFFFFFFLKWTCVINRAILHSTFPRRAPGYPRIITYSDPVYLEKHLWTINSMIHLNIIQGEKRLIITTKWNRIGPCIYVQESWRIYTV